MDRASGLLTASKHVRDVVNYWMTEGPRNSHTTDQKVWGSNPYGRARYIYLRHQLNRAPIELRAVEITVLSLAFDRYLNQRRRCHQHTDGYFQGK